MKLKLSTLIMIIGLIFLGYYYFIYAPCNTAAGKSQNRHVVPIQYPPKDEGVTILDLQPSYDSYGLTDLDYSDNFEHFDVTPIDEPESRQAIQATYDPSDTYELAGNVRPDNVMNVSEGVTLL